MMKIAVIEALDHFSTNNPEEKESMIRVIGEYMGEDEKYVILRSLRHDPELKLVNPQEDTHHVMKAAILRRKEIDFSWDGENND